MEIFFRVLQGAYAYVLIGQILVVTLLLLTLLWLVVRRTREGSRELDFEISTVTPEAAATKAAAETAAAKEKTPPVATVPAAVAAAAQEASATATAKVEELQMKVSEAEAEVVKLREGAEEARGLKDKLKYLESKLLEYEILQEEIGTLSALKVENEDLKKRLVDQGSKPSEPGAPPAAVSTSSPTTQEPIFDGALDRALIFDAPTGPVAASPAAAPKPAPPATSSAADAPPELQNLLDQIDELTKDGPSQKS